MKKQQKRINSILGDLYVMHEQLFGHKYAVGTQLNEESEFTKIIESFRELIFTIRQTQDERAVRQKTKDYHRSPEGVRINHEIREDLVRAKEILAEAVKRVELDLKRNKKNAKKGIKDPLSLEIINKREKVIENCYELLKDAQETEQGGTYHPPSYPTLQQIKKKLIGREYEDIREDSINIEQEQFFDQAAQKDQEMDKQLDQIIEGNDRIQGKLKLANQKIDETNQKIAKAAKKTDSLNERVVKANNDLVELLKNYRRPNQLCLDITLVFLVLALIGVVINMLR